MSTYLALVASDLDAPATASARAIAALRLAGTQAVERQHARGFAAAAARTGARPALLSVDDLTIVGDVRLDDRTGLQSALRVAAVNDLMLVGAAWRAWGVRAIDRLRGDFSFVLWDATTSTLIGARDGMGVRPLYYAQLRDTLVVSNVLDAVRGCEGISAALHEPAVRSFLERGWNADTTTTTFSAIRRLAPGTMIVRTPAASLAVRTHWTIPDPEPLTLRDDGAYVERYRELLAAAVRDRLESPATLLFLSGGIDSPSIAAAAAAEAGTETRLISVTMRTHDVEDGTEARLAASVAARLGIPNRLIDANTDPRPEERRQTPEPYDDAEFAGYCSMLAGLSASSSVVFDGEDGDALFSPPGFAAMIRRYPVASLLVRCMAYTLQSGRHPYMGFWLARRLGLARDEPVGVPSWLTRRASCIPDARETSPLPNRARPEAAARFSGSIWQSVMDGADRAWHGAPIEVRWPLLDSRILEFVFAIPPVPWCQRKHLARRAFAAELPAEVILRPKTTVPGYHARLVQNWRERTGAAVAELDERTRDFVDPVELDRVLRSGGTEHVLAAWRALQFDQWIRGARAA